MLAVVIAEQSYTMRYFVALQLVQLVLVDQQNLGLAVQTNELKLLGLVLFVELLVKELVLLLRLGYVVSFSLVLLKHRVNRVLEVAHELTVEHGATVLLVPLSEARVLVQLGQDFV